MKNHYTPEEAEAILRRAIERAPMPDEMSHDDLKKIADEMGISADALVAAEEEWLEEAEEEEERAQFDQTRQADFRAHLMSYVGVIGFLALLNLITSPGYFWAIFPALGWGLGLYFHFMATIHPSPQTYEEEYLKWRLKRSGGRVLSAGRARLPSSSARSIRVRRPRQ